MLREKVLYSLRDISIVPAVSTSIKSRKECDPFRKSLEGKEGWYPLIASPMDSVMDDMNWTYYWDNKISCVVPRSIPQSYQDADSEDGGYEAWFTERRKLCAKVFCAFSLKEARWFLENPYDGGDKNFSDGLKIHVLIDIANGSMQEEIDLGAALKRKYGDGIVLMGGNIGNPQTYLLYDAAGFDFLRVGIGSGQGCLTSTSTAIHYPYASLISEISEMKYRYHSNCKIIADGGMLWYSDIIKSLALGADYVMCGNIFAKAAKTPDEIGQSLIYRGMSTKAAQAGMGNTGALKTAEGKSMEVKKEYTLSGWTENFDSYLRSAMSYCDARSLKEFREKAVCQVISPNASSQINNK
jgi:IMP dehydrogenase/GMP reductase